MITIFNRKELLNTRDIAKCASVKGVLKKSKIDYYEKVINTRSNNSFLGHQSGSVLGAMGENPQFDMEYILYVRKKDFDEAVARINRYGKR